MRVAGEREARAAEANDEGVPEALRFFRRPFELCDAAPFVGNPDKNVTLSIVAFAWRASEYLADEMRKGNV